MNKSIWDRRDFNQRNVNLSNIWKAGFTLKHPYCFIPNDSFTFGGKQFFAGYKTIAFETDDAGYVIQQGPNSLLIGRE